MSTPSDAEKVLASVRLGWYVAEVRGRNQPNGPKPPAGPSVARTSNELPLRVERSATELRIEAQSTLTALAIALEVNTDHNVTSYGESIDSKAMTLHQSEGANKNGAWNLLAKTIYDFDAHVQDVLTSTSDAQACGYQLGRGLAETYWSFQAGDHSAESWKRLLEDRHLELSRLVGRLANYLPSYTAPAVDGSIQTWCAVASDSTWRAQSSATDKLYLQVRRWYELIVLGQDPTTLLKPYALLRSLPTTWKVIRGFWAQLAMTAVSIACIVLLIVGVADGSGTTLGKALLGAVSAVGLSTASLSTRLKNAATSLLQRLRQDAYTELIAVAITIVPPVIKPNGDPAQQRVTDKVVAKHVALRRITMGTA